MEFIKGLGGIALWLLGVAIIGLLLASFVTSLLRHFVPFNRLSLYSSVLRVDVPYGIPCTLSLSLVTNIRPFYTSTSALPTHLIDHDPQNIVSRPSLHHWFSC